MRANDLHRRARRALRPRASRSAERVSKDAPLVAAGLFAALALVSVPTLASSASCSPEVVAQIRPAPGHACWTYHGAATSFVGSFSSGEAVSAQMAGKATDYDPRGGAASTVWRPRDPNVEGPGGFFFGAPEAPGVLTFVAPATGTYRFSFSPCAMWGAPGAVRICAR